MAISSLYVLGSSLGSRSKIMDSVSQSDRRFVAGILGLKRTASTGVGMDQDEPHQIATSIISRLVRAWNTANGAAWGAEFVEDADFVNIFGVQRRGRTEIEKRHQYLFDVLFAGSECDM